MISKRFYSSHSSQLIKYFEQSITNVNILHTDIVKRQEYIHRQLNGVYADMDFLDYRITEIKNSISSLNVRLDALEQKSKSEDE